MFDESHESSFTLKSEERGRRRGSGGESGGKAAPSCHHGEGDRLLRCFKIWGMDGNWLGTTKNSLLVEASFL